MELVNFLNENKDTWRKILAAEPYNVKIKDDGDYSILEYDLLNSDMNLELVKECRGTIIRKDQDSYKVVCYAFRKFGNYGEGYADTNLIDWSMGVDVQQKVDGSLMKLFYDQGAWHLATNGTIDAFKASCGDTTFGNVFYMIVEKYVEKEKFLSYFDPNYVYMFEMVHPLYNPIVVHYSEPAIYYLGRRDMRTFEEDNSYEEIEDMNWIKYPMHFHYHSLYECIEAAHKMGDDEEGYVVTAVNQKFNGSFLRVKVKGDKYLALHKMRGNGPLTVQRVVEMHQEGVLDDFLAYFPEHREFVDVIARRINYLIDVADIAYTTIMSYGIENRAEYAKHATSYIGVIKAFLFMRLDGKVSGAAEYFKSVKAKVLADAVKENFNYEYECLTHIHF